MSGFSQRLSGRSIFEELFGGLSDENGSFNIDARDEKGNIVIRADLPGVNKDDISITLENGELTISAERKSQVEETTEHVYVKERKFGSFTRTLRVPQDVSDDVHATLKDGVLQLILQRTEAAKPRKIEIS